MADLVLSTDVKKVVKAIEMLENHLLWGSPAVHNVDSTDDENVDIIDFDGFTKSCFQEEKLVVAEDQVRY